MPDFMMFFRGGECADPSPESMQQVVQEYIAWVNKLRQQGKYKAGDELQMTGRVVRVADGRIVDGPFAETKEAIGGYILIEAADYDEAVQLSKDCPGLKNDGQVEIRQISDYS